MKRARDFFAWPKKANGSADVSNPFKLFANRIIRIAKEMGSHLRSHGPAPTFPGEGQYDVKQVRHRDLGKTGSLACRWIEDALSGKLTDGGHLPGLILNCPAAPSPESSGHNLRLVEQHSSYTGSVPADFLLSFWCQSCRHHIVFRIFAAGSVCNDEYLMHHLVCTSHVDAQSSPERSRYNPLLSKTEFQCSAAVCCLRIVIEVSEPRLPVEYIPLLTDRAHIRAKLDRLAENEPTRFAEFLQKPEKLARLLPAGYLAQYVADIVDPRAFKEDGNGNHIAIPIDRFEAPRKISTRNKIFQICFSGDLEALFEIMEFEKRSDEAGDEYYFTPRLDDPHTDAPTLPSSRRGWYENIFIEVASLCEKNLIREIAWLDLSINRQGDARLPWTVLARILGTEFYTRTQAGVSGYDTGDFDTLGVLPDVHETLLVYAYICQSQTAPRSIESMFQALQNVTLGRTISSADLRNFIEDENVKMAVHRSMQDTQPIQHLPQQALDSQNDSSSRSPYKYFNVDPTCDDSQIINSYQVHMQSSPNKESKIKHRDNLMKLGRERDSSDIMEVARDFAPVQAALDYLGVQLVSPPDYIVAVASLLVDDSEDEGKDKGLVAEALRVVARHMNDNILLLQKAEEIEASLTSPTIAYQVAPEEQPGVAMDLPVGLINLRNTCYLNSILQYFFTVNVVRDIVLNRNAYRLEPTEASLSERRLAGSASRLDRGEAYLSQRFIEELGNLFQQLQTSREQAVRPTQSLALAALKTSDELAKSGSKRLAQMQEDSVPQGTELPPPPPLPARRSPAPPALPQRNDAIVPTVTVNAVSDQAETASNVSSQTLVNQTEEEPEQNYVSIVCKPSGDDTGTPALGREPQTEESKQSSGKSSSLSEIGTDELMDLVEDEDSKKEAEQPEANIPDVSPPEPTIEEKIAAALDDDTSVGTTQEDVEEVMGNILEHLSAAIKPTGTDPITGAQTDAVTDTFYWTSVKHLRTVDSSCKPTSNFKQKFETSRWMTAFPAKKGPNGSSDIDIYEALDMSFDQEFQEDGIEQYTSIVKPPQILHIYIQRSQNDRTKNIGHIEIPPVLYLDRYMDSEEGSSLYKKRLRSWNLKRRIESVASYSGGADAADTEDPDWVLVPDKESKIDLYELTTDESSIESGDNDEDFTILHDSLRQELAANGVAVNEIPGRTREDVDMSEPGSSESASEDAEAARKVEEQRQELDSQYKQELKNLFLDTKQHTYHLHAVICHGSPKIGSGHYWVWIYDFEQNVWRQYNDTRVTVEPDSNVVLEKLRSSPDPYYISYVREEDIDALVKIPRRHQPEGDVNQETRDTEMQDVPFIQHVENNGAPPPYAA